MLFLLDHDVDAGVASLLRRAGNRCVTASEAGLATADDDSVAVFADDHRAVLITHDREAIRRRRRNTYGRHVRLTCMDWEAIAVIEARLPEVLEMIETRDAIVLKVSKDRVVPYPREWT
ncbi:MAG TPA: DUF5615 family PIN-like protein [Micromonosporaceae bacterium]